MSWWGKVLGGAFGFALAGPLGALIGAALGHNFDRGLRSIERAPGDAFTRQERAQTAFFAATFSVMGHIAKADGRVTQEEVRLAADVMRHMGLDAPMRRAAQNLFAEGKTPGFELDPVLDQLRRECRHSRNLMRMFLEIQLQAAYADGSIHPGEQRILLHACEERGFSAAELEQLDSWVQAERRAWADDARGGRSEELDLEDAYAILDVRPQNTDAEVTRAYRRLMSQHHPDKLVARGLPEEMMKVATEKTQEIRLAYERVRGVRSM